MADKKTYKTASGAQQYGSTEDFRKQKDASFKRFLENPTTKNALMENTMGAGYYGARSKEFKSDTYGELEQLLSGFAKDNKDKLKKEEKPKAGPKGNVKKMAEGGKMSDLAPKTSMRPKPRPKSMEARTVSSSKRGDSGPAAGTPNPLTAYMGKEREDRRKDLKEKVSVEKKAMGGKCRGMGAASRGGSFKVNG